MLDHVHLFIEADPTCPSPIVNRAFRMKQVAHSATGVCFLLPFALADIVEPQLLRRIRWWRRVRRRAVRRYIEAQKGADP